MGWLPIAALQRGGPGKLGMALEESDGPAGRRSFHGPHRRPVQRGDAGEAQGRRSLFRNSRRVLEAVAKRGWHVGV